MWWIEFFLYHFCLWHSSRQYHILALSFFSLIQMNNDRVYVLFVNNKKICQEIVCRSKGIATSQRDLQVSPEQSKA